ADGIRDFHVTGVQTCALPILHDAHRGRIQDRAQEVQTGMRQDPGTWRRWHHAQLHHQLNTGFLNVAKIDRIINMIHGIQIPPAHGNIKGGSCTRINDVCHYMLSLLIVTDEPNAANDRSWPLNSKRNCSDYNTIDRTHSTRPSPANNQEQSAKP